MTTGLVSSVSVRLVAFERNSVTRPRTLTSSPTLTPAAADAPKTWSPSEVSGLASGVGSWM